MFARFIPFLLGCAVMCWGQAPGASVTGSAALTYSTYLRQNFTPKAIATDPAGNIYLAGIATVAGTGPQTTALVVKLNPQASQYLYVRYLGGSVYDYAGAIAVDSAGNAYVAGYTDSPDFPVTSGGNLGTAPQNSFRSFVAKLDPNGEVVFSDLLGGSAGSTAESVAVNASGQIVVSGSAGAGFPTTPGAYSSASGGYYLMELDPTGAKMVFSAVGIGGSALAFDAAGNIYVAGSTTQTNYPTTPGAFQTTFPTILDCPSPDCFMAFPGANQYVTKVDPTGSKLIYSTAVTGMGNTGNAGLAVDAAGEVYVTGFAGNGYPYTVAVPLLPIEQAPAYATMPFLSKLDAAGKTLLFSVPVGGAGVQIDSSGAVYVGGYVGASSAVVGVLTSLPVLGGIPSQCLPNPAPGTGGHSSAYAAEVDGGSGNLVESKFIGGTGLTLSTAALIGSTLWVAGSASAPDFPFTPGALTLAEFGASLPAGAYLGAVAFGQPQPPVGTPQIACVVDGADFAGAGPVARNQVLTIFGSGLGPVAGVSAANNSATNLGGVSVKFTAGAAPALNAPVLYASSTQVNLAVPLFDFSEVFTTMQLTVNGAVSAPVEMPLELTNPSLFGVVLNGDGSMNSSGHAAAQGSSISVFVNGLSGLAPEFPQGGNIPAALYAGAGWPVLSLVPVNPFVLRVDLGVPKSLPTNVVYCPPGQAACVTTLPFSLYYFDPDSVASGNVNGQAVEGFAYVTAAQ